MEDSDKCIKISNGNKLNPMAKLFVALNIMLIPFVITWVAWVTTNALKHTQDRFTGAMFIDVQDELKSRNPELKWLEAKDIRDIQRRNSPYADR